MLGDVRVLSGEFHLVGGLTSLVITEHLPKVMLSDVRVQTDMPLLHETLTSLVMLSDVRTYIIMESSRGE